MMFYHWKSFIGSKCDKSFFPCYTAYFRSYKINPIKTVYFHIFRDIDIVECLLTWPHFILLHITQWPHFLLYVSKHRTTTQSICYNILWYSNGPHIYTQTMFLFQIDCFVHTIVYAGVLLLLWGAVLYGRL